MGRKAKTPETAEAPWFQGKLRRDDATGCLVYRGKLYDGVAYLRVPGGPVKRLARIVYEHAHGTQPRHVVVMPTCGNRACGELSHLKAGTMAEALLAGPTMAAANASKEACKRGHPFDEANTYRDPSGRRRCRACIKMQWKGWIAEGDHAEKRRAAYRKAASPEKSVI